MENRKSTDHWPKLDILQGEVKTYFSLPKNTIHTQQYNHKFSILISILHAVGNPASIVLIFILALSIVVPEASPYTLVMNLSQLALIFMAAVVKQIIVKKIIVEADAKINRRTTKVYRGKQQFQQMEWGDIQLGDIVYLMQGEVVPADIIVLDSQQIQHREAITYVDVKQLNGQMLSQKKKSSYLTQLLNRSSMQKRVWQEYRKILSGRITYEKPSASIDEFNGYLKLTKDPKVQKLSIQNLILRQSTIKTSLWIYGLVIYTGMNTKVMQNFKISKKSTQIFGQKNGKIFFIMVALSWIASITFIILYKYRGTHYESNSLIIIYHFLIFSVMAPFLLFFGENMLLVAMKFASKNNDIQIRDYQHFKQIGQLSYAMISNVGILNTGKLQVNEIVTESSIYIFDGENSGFENSGERPTGINGRRMGSSVRMSNQGKQLQNKLLLPIVNYDKRASALVYKEEDGFIQDENFQIDDDSNVRIRDYSPNSPTSSIQKATKFNNHLEPLKMDKNRFYNYVKRSQNQSTQIIKALGLCHQAKLHYDKQKDRYVGVSNVNSQQVLLKLVNFVGWSLMPKMIEKKQVGITILQEKQKINEENGTFTFESLTKTTYYWTGINSFNISRKLFSVIVTSQRLHTLYCKGRPEDILQRLKLNKQTQKIIEQTIASYSKKQSQIIIYAKRQLSDDQKQIYENDYISLKSSLTTTQKQIQQFSKRYQKNLQFICIIGMSAQINSQAESLIKHIRTSGIRPCIFAQQKSQIISMKKLIAAESQKYHDIQLQFQSAEMLKYYLNEATNLLNNNHQFKYIVTITGNAWQIIQSNSQLMQHFMFVLFYAQALVACNFKPDDIKQLTHKVRCSYPQQQNVLGIGYSYADLRFLFQSNVSISPCEDLPTDMKVSNIKTICEVLRMGPGMLMIRMCKHTIIMYRVLAISTVTLVYEILLAYYSTSQNINGNLVFIYLVVSVILEMSYNAFNYQNIMKEDHKGKYQDFREIKKKYYIQYGEAVIHGGMIILSLFFNLAGVKIYTAKVLPIQALDLAVFISLILVGSLRNFFKPQFSRLTSFITTSISFCVIALCLYLAALANSTSMKIFTQFAYLFQSYDAITSILNCVIFCLAISYFLEEILKKKVMFTTSEHVKPEQKQNNKQQMINLIKHLFKHENNMQTSLKDIASKHIDVNQFKITTWLSIKDQQQDIKYKSNKVGINRLRVLKLLVISCLFFATLFLLQFLVTIKSFYIYELIPIVGLILSIMLFIFLYVQKDIGLMSYHYHYLPIALIILCILLLTHQFYTADNHDFLLICFLSIGITQNFNNNFFILLGMAGGIYIVGVVLATMDQDSTLSKAIYPIYQIVIIAFNLRIFYQVQLNSKMSFVNTEAFQKESNYVNDILSILVPKFIKNHLQGNQFALQQQQKKVSILFCYVCNFDQIVKEQGTNVVSLMDQLFRQFDQLCHNFAVQKIETVGQTYMAATGIKAYEDQIQTEMKKRNQVERLLKMAIQMLQKSKDIMWGIKKNKKINLKIGIHHGNVMIGVIGFHKPQFSLIGDTVNTTSRHCSTAGPGEIVVSSVAYELLRKFPASAFTKSTKTMKGLGEVPVYKYNNNNLKEESHLRMRIKFQSIVRKIIEKLKNEGKIHYKKFKASEFAERAILHQRLNTKKMTKKSEPRRSLQLDSFKLDPITKQYKQNEMCLQFNWLLQIQNTNIKFKKHLIQKHLNSDRMSICVMGFVFLINYIIHLAIQDYCVEYLALASIGLILFPILFFLYKNSIKNNVIKIGFMIACIYLILVSSINQILTSQKQSTQTIPHINDFFSFIAVIVYSSLKSFRFIDTVIVASGSMIVCIVATACSGQYDQGVIYHFFVLVLICTRKYSHLRDYYRSYNQSQVYQKKTQEQSALVSQLLPKHAYEKLKNNNIQNKLQLTDQFQQATILFADIKGFTSYSNQSTPAGVVKMLRQLFEQFDKLCLKFNVYKVYTIGDCYVVLGFTNCYQRQAVQQAKNVVNMGLAMVQTIQRVRQRLDFMDLDMRIGIHTGTIIGGIIGTDIVRYDIYGPDVMVANKFEEYGKTGCIHISESTKQVLEKDKKKCFNISPYNTVKVEKLNAEYNGYLLTKKKFQI